MRHRRVLGYARVSSEEQARGTSLADQQNAISAYARGRGMTVERFYVESESAVREKIEHRAEMRRLMADAREGDLVLCDKLDRWSRDPEFSYKSVRELREKGASVYFVGDACDPSTPDGDSMMSFRILFAREEHKRIKLRMVGTRKLLRDRGYYVEGLPPFGYRRAQPKGYKGAEKNILVVHADEAATVREIFRLCIQGRSLSEIAERLELKRDRVHHVLHSRAFVGEVQATSGEWIRARHEAIIDAATWQRAQDALEERRNAPTAAHRRKPATATWILRDVATCGHCGARMSSAYGGSGRTYYKCARACVRRFVAVVDAEAVAGELVLARLVELRDLIAHAAKAPPVPRDEVDYGEKLAKLDRRRDKYLEAFADDLMTREELRERLSRVDEQRMKVESERLAVERPDRLATAAARREMSRSLLGLERAWRDAPAEARRQIVNQLAKAVALVAGKDPKPEWRTPEELAEEIAS